MFDDAPSVALLDSLLEGCNIIGFDRRYRYVNPAAALHGRQSIEALLGSTMPELFPGVEDTPLYTAILRCLDERVATRMETSFSYPDGSVGWFQVSIEPVKEGAFILSVDMTERYQMTEALRWSEARLRGLLRGIPDTVFVVDHRGVFLDCHVPDPALLLVPPEEFLGRSMADVLPMEVVEPVLAEIDVALRSGGKREYSYQLTVRDEVRWYVVMIVPTDADRVTLVVRDTTAARNLEDQLRQAQKMEAVGQLTGGIAHDLNNMLTVIGSNAEVIAESLATGGSVQDELAELEAAVRRGADMIDRLLRFSRRGMLERCPLDAAGEVRAFVPVLRRMLPESVGIVEEMAGPTGVVMMDPGAVQQVLANLCTNARDAMDGHGTIIIETGPSAIGPDDPRIHLGMTPGPYARIAVRDNGVGMDRRTLARIFDPFFTTKPAGVGTGLGMSMVYGLMQAHGGAVEVDSTPGQGTAVALYFPVLPEESPQPTPGTPRSPLATLRGTETILLVEDEPAIRRVAAIALRKMGYVVLEAADGQEGIEVHRAHLPGVDIIVTDLVMPRMGGRQMVDVLRAEGVQVPVVVMSGYDSEGDLGGRDLPTGVLFLQKPWTLSDLAARVRGMLDVNEGE
ncbi:MAG: PAS domain-containing protein [Gemmatimonadales bacterium]|nr:PAS domain-containing protein [Gemmatimonadales bacterium]